MTLGATGLIRKIMKLQFKQESVILLYSYVISLTILLGIYLLDFSKNLFLHLILFLSIILLNRILNEFQKTKNRYIKFIHTTEICFIVFLLMFFILKENYFIQYKLLVLPPLILSIIQTFSLKKMKKNNVA
jgi:hypothetical protein